LLYKVQVVWPPPNLRAPNSDLEKSSYTLAAGSYQYPFDFKLPFNNACQANQKANTLSQLEKFAGLQLNEARTPTRHVKATLPPSVYFPGEAEIRYFVKCTVNRPSLFKENPRAYVPFNFFPIEPPRTPQNGETYARRQHQFNPESGSSSATVSRKASSFFSKLKGSTQPTTDLKPSTTDENPSIEPPRFSLEARLPNPAILTCSACLPLKLLLKQLSPRKQALYLQTLQIELLAYTKIRAHEVQRTETHTTIIVSKSALSVPLGSPTTDSVGTETEIPR
ncbi:hypothetical protein LTS18_014402, partial [Coniosporium uncinatum]